MNVLNIDLDFFLNKIADNRFGDIRLDKNEFLPWNEKDFRLFLENKCRLNTAKKIPGKIITHHDEAFYIFKNLYKDDSNNQISLTHIDAHTDLKAGFPNVGLLYILHTLNNIPIENRKHKIDLNHMGPANYLSFAISLNLFSKILFVHHSDYNNEDMPVAFFKDLCFKSGFIEMKGYDVDDFDLTSPINVDHQIPFYISSKEDYCAQETYDYIIFCQSPAYTPCTSDFLLDVVKEYIIDDI